MMKTINMKSWGYEEPIIKTENTSNHGENKELTIRTVNKSNHGGNKRAHDKDCKQS